MRRETSVTAGCPNGHIVVLCPKNWGKCSNALNEDDENILEEVHEHKDDFACRLKEEVHRSSSKKSKNITDVKNRWVKIRVTMDTGIAGHAMYHIHDNGCAGQQRRMRMAHTFGILEMPRQ